MKQRQKEMERTSSVAAPSAKPKNKPVKSKPKKPQAKYGGIVIVLLDSHIWLVYLQSISPTPNHQKKTYKWLC